MDKVIQIQKRRPIVTIGIGMICNNGIVMASDSQVSYAGLTHKRQDAKKLFLIEFGQSTALLNMAGGFDLFSHTLENIQKKAATFSRDSAPTDYREIPELIQASIKETRQSAKSQWDGFGYSSEFFDKLFQDYLFEITFGYYFHGQPYLYTIDLALGVPVAVHADFVAKGAAFQLADFILAGYSRVTLTRGLAGFMAAYAVEMAKVHDTSCGGRTQIGYLTPDGKGEIEIPEVAEGLEESAKAYEAKNRKVWVKALLNEAEGVLQRLSAEISPDE
ncbi:MAG: hypothetical protein ABSG50_05495 [Opitutaceae bacterium]|jgi:20S proteasome alpha/beta subunit